MFEPFTLLTAVAVPIDDRNVDTGRIFPSRFLRKPRTQDFGNYLFHDYRFDENGTEKPDFIMNRPPYRSARIMVTGSDFGTGSSRESAVHAFLDAGFRCIISPSFGEIFYANCFRNGLLPVIVSNEQAADLRRQLHRTPGVEITIDLDNEFVRGPDGREIGFDITPTRKMRLQRGLDDCAMAQEFQPEIDAFLENYARLTPWIDADRAK